MNSRNDILVRGRANIPHPIHLRDVSKRNQQFTPNCDRYIIVQQHNTHTTGTLYTPFYMIEHTIFLFRIIVTKMIMKFFSIGIGVYCVEQSASNISYYNMYDELNCEVYLYIKTNICVEIMMVK